MSQLLFIRHGSTAGNLARRYIGVTDEPLCEAGISQVKALQNYHFTADQVFVSPMLRTRQTAELLFPNTPYSLVPDFSEINFGLFEGKTAAELSRCPEYQTWVDSGCLDPIPHGEPVSLFKRRCCLAFQRVLNRLSSSDCAAFVVHGGVIMSILEAYAQPKRTFYQYQLKNGGCFICRFDGSIHISKEL